VFKTVEELKAFILWAKSEKIARIKVGDVEAEMSNVALLPEAYSSITQSQTQPNSESQTTTSESQDDEELLMWSARP